MIFIDITYDDGTYGVLNAEQIVHFYWDSDRKFTVILMTNAMRMKVKETPTKIVQLVKSAQLNPHIGPVIGGDKPGAQQLRS